MEQVIYQGLGRRKRSTARITLIKGDGKVIINKMSAKAYLMNDLHVSNLLVPMVLTKTDKDFDVKVNVRGGGLSGQSDAIRLGIARALLKASEDYHTVLKKNGLLTRDSRIKERKKPGLRKARRARQFSKR